MTICDQPISLRDSAPLFPSVPPPPPLLEAPMPLDGSASPHLVSENIILSMSAAVSVILTFLPPLVLAYTKSMETALRVFRPSTMWATILNSSIWIFYTFIVVKKDDSMELVLAYPMQLANSFFYLLIVYGHHGRTWMATILSTLVIPCVAYVFYAIRFHTSLPESWETGLGCSGLLLLLWSHTCLMQDIYHVAGYLDYVVTTINIVLPGLLNGATVYILLKNHPDQHFIVLSSLIGLICFMVEVMLLVNKFIVDNCYGGGDNGPDDFPDDFPNPNAEVQNENHPVIDHAENENANGANDVANEHDPAAADQNVNGHNNGVHEGRIDIVVNGSGAAAGNHNINEHHEYEDHRPRVEMRADYSLPPRNTASHFGICFKKKNFYDLHHGILGILYSVLITAVITVKVYDITHVTTGVICHGEKSVIKEGHKSFPNGHTSYLSHNLLTSGIPSDISNMINSLNLSSNQLTSEVPVLLQIAAYDRSFLGNTGLCARAGSGTNLPTCRGGGRGTRDELSKGLIILFAMLAGIVLVGSMGIAWLLFRCWKERKESHEVTDWKMSPFRQLSFTESNVLSNICEGNVIGSGGSGKVYRIHLSCDKEGSGAGRMVAMKRIWNWRKVDAKLDKEFESEVKVLGSIRHDNIVKLLCCISSQEAKLLVYEYMEIGSLDRRDREGAPAPLDWPTRLAIAIDAAKGLSYMHHDCAQPIVHRDVKSSNILLDPDLQAKIADFRLARILVKSGEPESVSAIGGTFGYMTPDYGCRPMLNEDPLPGTRLHVNIGSGSP